MERGKGLIPRLWWCLFSFTLQILLTNCEAKSCAPSRCGTITDIHHPFRLPQDPPHCGDERYELACENNDTTTTLSLYSGKYRVLAINYNNFTIRLVDPGIQRGNCSSLPRYFLSQSNFSDTFNYSYGYDADPFRATQTSVQSETIFEHVVYLNCSDPVTVRDDDAAEYVDTDSCVNWGGEGYGYAVIGDLLAKDFKRQCRIKMVAAVRSDWGSLLLMSSGERRVVSYGDVHKVVSYGFEVSWWKRACDDVACPSTNPCVYEPSTESIECQRPVLCYSPMGIEYWNCGNLSKARIFAEDYLYGIYKGLRQIIGVGTYDHYTHYDFSLTPLAITSGIVTGNYIIPYITARVLFGITFLSALLIYTCQRRHLSVYENIEDFLQLHDLIPIRYSYKELKTMTKGFKNKLGQGGFGKVYKGKLSSGLDVAIKMLGKSEANGQDFISEVATIGRIHHFNVVRLVGFCVEGRKRALVYEFMSNGSLDKYIFSKEGSVPLSYEKIYEISLGVTRGIAYLHHGCDMQILHFDIKPHNILLDENFIPKVSDFGLARLYPVDDSIVTLTVARGTIGYMAPELFYKNIGGVSYKADVYSFGMLLMEMASRKRNSDSHTENSSQFYFPLWIYDQFNEVKDLEIEDLTKEEKDLAKKMFIVALWCIQLKPIDRPSMKRVVEMLEADDIESLEMPPKPSLYPNERNVYDIGSNFDQSTSFYTMDSSSDLGEVASYEE
ncbi:LEAF RUST 10 DISEASE-RESISTANCE LOCUS RECEPTOR-LIKE PROTEIN KINASE-like 2.1 [Senna tora]|uniref:LEAF RUST 10 DISEASE-RESISTANCE LOCUS RECEPTOR-LIKE PROTEIN KINASE-like 2.1 n=1 Tax=Senna tora TaxID=362788 RepID=A0A834W7D6_9FABA|nr:LEAF RUST 10 DISEASE-RESISTANCE LOCUS RECEPTOR-LIKE PROTEIN KINASE-like 2.1 [Senna tora]